MPRDRYDDEDEDDDRPRRRRRDDDDDEDDRPRRSRGRSAPQGNGMAVASLVLGILSICFGPITGVIGGILGVLGMNKPTGKGMAITGMGLSGLFSVVWIVLGVWAFTEGRKQVQTAVDRAANKKAGSDNFKAMGIASHSYHDVHNKMPAAFVRKPGEFPGQVPTDLNDRLGWRVSLLPYIEEDGLYRQTRQDQPWNSPANLPLSNTPVKGYSDPDAPTDPTTRIRCFYDNGAAFDVRSDARLPGSFTDGTSNTILFVEGGDKVTWTRFQEYKFDPKGPLPTLGRADRDTFLVVMVDGSVRAVKKSVSETTLKNAINRQDGMVLGPDW
jgi:hypothetical protein